MNKHRFETGLETLSDQVHDALRRGKFTWEELQYAIAKKSKKAARRTNDYVHDEPWKVIGLVAILSILIGLLMPRK